MSNTTYATHDAYADDLYTTRQQRSKAEWAGIGIGDAFKPSLPYYLRLLAQRLLYRSIKKAQLIIARLSGATGQEGLQPKVKPQLSPCYTTYPATLAAPAAIGLTAFLELEARVSKKSLFVYLDAYRKNPAEADEVDVDPESYKAVAEMTTRHIQTRLLLQELSRIRALSAVEIYRLFSASQESLRFDSLSEILRAVVLYGDVLPQWQSMALHPLTRALLTDLGTTSAPFFEELGRVDEASLIDLGVRWVEALCRTLAKYLPPPKDNEAASHTAQNNPVGTQAPQQRFGDPQAADVARVGPLEGLGAPSLHPPENVAQQIANAIAGWTAKTATQDCTLGQPVEDPAKAQISQTLTEFAQAIDGAGGQQRDWEDVRSDVLEHQLRNTPFQTGPIEGNPAGGQEVRISIEGEELGGGEIFDRPVELSDDWPAHDRLSRDCDPIAQALKHNLYPNVQQVAKTQRFRTSGALDPARLALADFSATICRRYRIEEQADTRGRPVLVIACDGSGSLDPSQMKMVKLLSAAWLSATARSDVKVLAGLYHSGQIRPGVSGPLVQWIYHPQKTPTTNRREALRAIVALPDGGTGVQSDVLSIAFMLNEAKRLARRDMIYLILISDTQWNRSFRTQRDGLQEVHDYFQQAYRDFSGRLQTTLVALGVNKETGLEALLNEVIAVSPQELEDAPAVAKKIGLYVAHSMQKLRRLKPRH